MVYYIGDHSEKNLLELCEENGWNTLKHQLSSQQQHPSDRLVKRNDTEVCYTKLYVICIPLISLLTCRKQMQLWVVLWRV